MSSYFSEGGAVFRSARILIVFSRVVRKQTSRHIFHNLHQKDLFFSIFYGEPTQFHFRAIISFVVFSQPFLQTWAGLRVGL